MQRALALADKGRGCTSPNPMVGCVIVHNDEIIGEGYHQKYGDLHAEPNAVNSVSDKSLIAQSTVYVTLEPCAHYGKTPPCAELLARLVPRKVIIASVDTNPLVGGKGIQKMKDAGIEVLHGLMDEENRYLNRRFFTFMEKKRPYIILKWAQTADGFVARKNYDSKWISNEASRTRVHEWRAEEDGIMVATNTALYDNPSLNVRLAEGADPVRILLDRTLKVPLNFNFYNQQQKTLIYNELEEVVDGNTEKIKLNFSNDIIPQLLEDLYERKIQSVIVEGGSQLLNGFINTTLWDEARIFTSKNTFEEGIAAPSINTQAVFEEDIEGDKVHYFLNKD